MDTESSTGYLYSSSHVGIKADVISRILWLLILNTFPLFQRFICRRSAFENRPFIDLKKRS
jgi:hypothetical protein